MAGIVNKVFCLKIFVTGAVVSAQAWEVLPHPRPKLQLSHSELQGPFVLLILL